MEVAWGCVFHRHLSVCFHQSVSQKTDARGITKLDIQNNVPRFISGSKVKVITSVILLK